ncbi:MAG: hypothetical protein QGH37_33835, partial [Candidatus Poribacteria bacterium]|nr:hypothetical protein [Candidatus Poribacteria bacterium]
SVEFSALALYLRLELNISNRSISSPTRLDLTIGFQVHKKRLTLGKPHLEVTWWQVPRIPEQTVWLKTRLSCCYICRNWSF